MIPDPHRGACCTEARSSPTAPPVVLVCAQGGLMDCQAPVGPLAPPAWRFALGG